MYDDIDRRIREYLIEKVPDYLRLADLKKILDVQRFELERKFQEDNKTILDEIMKLETEIADLYKRFVDDVQGRTTRSYGERKKYMDGIVVVQVRQRPGEYDSKKLQAWAKTYPGVLTAPKKDDRWLKYLQEHKPELLVVDEAAAVKLATTRTEDGRPVYDDSPVPVVDYVTTPSEDTFRKVMTQLEIEYTVDARSKEKTDE